MDKLVKIIKPHWDWLSLMQVVYAFMFRLSFFTIILYVCCLINCFVSELFSRKRHDRGIWDMSEKGKVCRVNFVFLSGNGIMMEFCSLYRQECKVHIEK